jgi:hypothetical protein
LLLAAAIVGGILALSLTLNNGTAKPGVPTPTPLPVGPCDETYGFEVQQYETNTDNYALFGQYSAFHAASGTFVYSRRNHTIEGIVLEARSNLTDTVTWANTAFCDSQTVYHYVAVDDATGDVFFAYDCALNVTVARFAAADGSLVWSTSDTVLLNVETRQYAASPLVQSATYLLVTVHRVDSGTSQFCALDLSTGAVLWCTAHAEPYIITTVADTRVYAVSPDRTLSVYDATTGVFASTTDLGSNTIVVKSIVPLPGTDSFFVTGWLSTEGPAVALVQRYDDTYTLQWETTVKEDRNTFQSDVHASALHYDATNGVVTVASDFYYDAAGRYRPFLASLNAATGAVLHYFEQHVVADDADYVRIGSSINVPSRAVYYVYQKYEYSNSSFNHELKTWCY